MELRTRSTDFARPVDFLETLTVRLRPRSETPDGTYPPRHLNFPLTMIASLLQSAAHSSIECDVKRTAAPTF